MLNQKEGWEFGRRGFHHHCSHLFQFAETQVQQDYDFYIKNGSFLHIRYSLNGISQKVQKQIY